MLEVKNVSSKLEEYKKVLQNQNVKEFLKTSFMVFLEKN